MRYSMFSILFLMGLCISINTGCVRSSGVMELARDTYNITTIAPLGDILSAKKEALSQANNHCRSMGKALVVQNYSMPGYGYYLDLTFTCVSPEQQPIVQYEKPADIVIKHK